MLTKQGELWTACREEKSIRKFLRELLRRTKQVLIQKQRKGKSCVLWIEEINSVLQERKRTRIVKIATLTFKAHNVHLVLGPVIHHREGDAGLRSLSRARFTSLFLRL